MNMNTNINNNSQIYKWIAKIQKRMDIVSKNILISTYQEEIDQAFKDGLLEEFKDSKFTLDNIQQFILACNTKYIYELDSIKLTVLCNNTGIKITPLLGKQSIMSLFRIKTILSMFHVNKPIQIVLLPITVTRKKPTFDKEPISPYHINGAYTYISNGIIYVYRVEEWTKVVLHEILHNVSQLQNISWIPNQIDMLYKTFNIDNDGCPNDCKTVLEPTESIIEAWAIFLHTVFLSIETGKEFHVLFEKELKWNDQQIKWILKKQIKLGGIWHESTHAFSYIVLRGILLHNLENFVSMKLPYKSDKIISLLIKNWNILKSKIIKGNYKNVSSLRMSKLGEGG